MENQTNEPNEPVEQNKTDEQKKLTPLPDVMENIIYKELPNSAHYNYSRRFGEVIGDAGPFAKNTIGAARITEYNADVALEGELMRWTEKSVLTAQIAEADHRLGSAWSAITTYVRTALYSDDTLIIASAERMNAMLRDFGNVIAKAYNKQLGDVEAGLDSMHGAYAADVTALSLGTRVAKLQAARDEFAALLHQRDADIGEKPKQNFSTVRHAVDEVGRQIVTIVNSGARLQLSQEFGAIIRIMNPEIVRFNEQYHHAKTDIKAAQPADIGPQPFTGLAVTPLPEVLLIKQDGSMKRLVFGVDYSLTYRNNVNVGKAECIIHGKGKYRGTNTVSFVIVHV